MKLYPILRLPRAFQALAMTVWVVCGCLYNEILTSSAKSRNDSFIIAMTMREVLSLVSFVIARSETTKQSTNHNKLMQKQKIKRIHYPLPFLSLRDFVEVVAIHKPQNHHKKTENKKKSLPFTPSSLRRPKACGNL